MRVFLDLKDLIEQTAVNFSVDMSGGKFNFNHICVLRVAKEHPNQFFFKAS
jgi:hypothetical protein